MRARILRGTRHQMNHPRLIGKALTTARISIFSTALGATLLLSPGCNTVEFYEKGAFADPAMEFTATPAQLHWQQKVQYSDEGAAGGVGTSAGGGCGCY